MSDLKFTEAQLESKVIELLNEESYPPLPGKVLMTIEEKPEKILRTQLR